MKFSVPWNQILNAVKFSPLMLTHSANVPLLCELALFYENCVKLCLPLQTVLQDELGWLEKEIELWVWASVLTTPDGNINCLRLHLQTPRCCFFSFSFFSFACYIWVESSSSSATRRWIIGFSRTQFEVLILKFVNLKNLVCVCQYFVFVYLTQFLDFFREEIRP
jgi:hypothetical protein